MNATDPVPFGRRLKELLGRRSQAWLAKRSGVDASVISRIVGGQRPPTYEALTLIGPSLELSLAELVRGTDAESVLGTGLHVVPSERLEDVLVRVVELESELADARARTEHVERARQEERRERMTLLQTLGDVQIERERAEGDLRAARATIHELQRQVQHQVEQNVRLTSLRDELERQLEALAAQAVDTGLTAKIAAILAGIAASAATINLMRTHAADPGDSDA